MKITKKSIISKTETTLEIPIEPEDFKAWFDGACIQNVAPYLSADDREFLISGITPEEWEATFGSMEAEELAFEQGECLDTTVIHTDLTDDEPAF